MFELFHPLNGTIIHLHTGLCPVFLSRDMTMYLSYQHLYPFTSPTD